VKPVAEQTLYEILEVPVDAPESEIVKAWERAEAMYGPGSFSTYTLISPDEAQVMSSRLEEALNVLLDPAERTLYDARIHAGAVAHAVPHAVPRSVNGDDGTAARWLAPLPPIIPPLAASSPGLMTVDRLLSAAHPEDVEPEGALPGLQLVPTPEAASPAEHRDAPAAEPAIPTDERGARGAAASSDESERADPPPILLTVVVEEASPIPLETPAPISPPFAALLESPAALAVSPLAQAPGTCRDPELARPQEDGAALEEVVVPQGEPFTGALLRRLREARGLSVQLVCERTKISRYHLENIEADLVEKLPAQVYLRGILMALAKELRLDGQKVTRSYLEAATARPPVKAR
jgi:hypothetical protein